MQCSLCIAAKQIDADPPMASCSLLHRILGAATTS